MFLVSLYRFSWFQFVSTSASRRDHSSHIWQVQFASYGINAAQYAAELFGPPFVVSPGHGGYILENEFWMILVFLMIFVILFGHVYGSVWAYSFSMVLFCYWSPSFLGRYVFSLVFRIRHWWHLGKNYTLMIDVSRQIFNALVSWELFSDLLALRHYGPILPVTNSGKHRRNFNIYSGLVWDFGNPPATDFSLSTLAIHSVDFAGSPLAEDGWSQGTHMFQLLVSRGKTEWSIWSFSCDFHVDYTDLQGGQGNDQALDSIGYIVVQAWFTVW